MRQSHASTVGGVIADCSRSAAGVLPEALRFSFRYLTRPFLVCLRLTQKLYDHLAAANEGGSAAER